MPDDFVMPPDPLAGGIDYGGFDTSGPLNLEQLEQPKKAALPYRERLSKYKAEGGTGFTNPWARGSKAGFLGGFAGDVGFLETAADILPYDPGKESLKGAGDFLSEMAGEVPLRSLKDVGGVLDALDYAQQAVGYTFGYLGSMVPTAIATGGATAAARVLGKEALKGIGKKELAKKGSLAISKAVTAPSIVQGIGHTYRGVRDETGVESPFLAVPVGIASGMMERFGLGKTFGTFFDDLPYDAKKKLWSQLMQSAVKAAGKSALIEGGTEAGQESLQIMANRIADDTYDMVNGDNLWRLLDASAMGAIGSAPFGAVGGAGNYMSGRADALEDSANVKKVNSVLSRIVPEGSMILFRQQQSELSEKSKQLQDAEFIPSQEEIEDLERRIKRIPEQRSFSETQKEALLKDANATLGKFRDRAKVSQADLEAAEVEASASVELAARKNREAAEKAAGVEPGSTVQETPAFWRSDDVVSTPIAEETQAPYNDSGVEFSVGDNYQHRLEGDTLVVAEVRDVEDGVVTEAVWADDGETPLVTTYNGKTLSLHSREEIERASALKENERMGVLDESGRIESVNQFMRDATQAQAEKRATEERNKKIEDEAGATIKGKKRTSPDELARRQNAQRLKTPPSTKPTKRTYVAKTQEPAKARVSKEESLIRVAGQRKKTLEKSTVVRVKKAGVKREVGEIKKVSIVQSNPSQFEASVKYPGKRAEVIYINAEGSGLFTTVEGLGSVEVIAANGKLTKAQEAAVSAKELGQSSKTVKQEEADAPDNRSRWKPARDRKKTPRATRAAQAQEVKDMSMSQPAKKPKVASVQGKTRKPKKGDAASPPKFTKGDRIGVGKAGVTISEKDAASLNKTSADASATGGIVMSDMFGFGLAIHFLKQFKHMANYARVWLKNSVKNGFVRSSKGYAARRKEFIAEAKDGRGFLSALVKTLEEGVLNEKGERIQHLPSFADDINHILGGIFDAVVDSLNGDIEKDYSQDDLAKILGDVVAEGNIQKYVDFPIQVEGAIPIANSNFFKGTDVGLDIENLTLIDDSGREYRAKLDFSTRKNKPVVTIKTVSANKDAVAYRMKDKAISRIVLQESKAKGREGNVVYAHIPNDLIIDANGVPQYDNFVKDSRKAKASFLKDVSWVGLSNDEFRQFLALGIKNKKLKEWYERESVRDGSFVSGKENVAGLIESAIIVSKTLIPKTEKGKKAKVVFRNLLKNKSRKIANMKAEELGRLLEAAIVLHLDHFHTNYSGKVSSYIEDTKETKRIGIIISQFEGALKNGPPQSIPLKKYDSDLKPIKGHFFSYPKYKKGGMGLDVTPRSTDKSSRLSKKDAEEVLAKSPSVIYAAKRVGSKFNEMEERAVRSVLTLAKEKKKELDRKYNAYTTDKTVVDYKITVEGYKVSEVDLAKLVEAADKAIKQDDYELAHSDVMSFYSEQIGDEADKFQATYKTSLPSESSDEGSRAQEVGDGGELSEQGKETGAVPLQSETGAQALRRKEEAEEERKFEEGLFEENTEIGKASKAFREARADILETLASDDLNNENYESDLIEAQGKMLKAWRRFLLARGTDFTPTSEAALLTLADVKKENLASLKAQDITESNEEKLEASRKRYDDAMEIVNSYESIDELQADVDRRVKEIHEASIEEGVIEENINSWEDAVMFLTDDLSKDSVGISGKQVLSEMHSKGQDTPANIKKALKGLRAATARKESITEEDILEDAEGLYERGGGKVIWNSLSEEPRFPLHTESELGTVDQLTEQPLVYEKFQIDSLEVAVRLRDRVQDAHSRKNAEILRMSLLGAQDEASERAVTIFNTNDPNKKPITRSELRGDKEKLTKRVASLKQKIKTKERQELDSRPRTKERRDTVKARKSLEKELVDAESALIASRQTYKSSQAGVISSSKLKKTGVIFKYIFDSFIAGGVRKTDAGNMFGILVSLLNKYNEDLYQSTGEFLSKVYNRSVKVEFGEGDVRTVSQIRVETPATLYYKLSKVLELKDYRQIIEHPAWKDSPLYVGPIAPTVLDGKREIKLTDEQWTGVKGERWRQIADFIKGIRYGKAGVERISPLSEKEANDEFIKQVILGEKGGVYGGFISMFTDASGYHNKKSGEAVVKKAIGLDSGGRRQAVMDRLSEALAMPFMPKRDEKKTEVEEEESVDADQLGKDMLKAGARYEKARQAFAENSNIAKEVGRMGRNEMPTAEDRAKAEKYQAILEEHTDARDKFNQLTFQLNQIEASKEGALSEVTGRGTSLDLIGNKSLSVTISNTLPRGYTQVRSSKPSKDKLIPKTGSDAKRNDTKESEATADAMLSKPLSPTSSTLPIDLGSATGADGIARLLQENSSEIGEEAVGKAMDILSVIPDRYLEELSLTIQSRVDVGGVRVAGSFVEALKTAFIPVDGNNPESFVHELTHYLHAFLPVEFQNRVSDLRRNALEKVVDHTEDGRSRYRIDMASEFLLNAETGTTIGVEGFQSYIDKYGDRAKDMYHLVNDNEFFVYLMTQEGSSDIQSLLGNSNTVGLIARIRSFLADLFKAIVAKVTGKVAGSGSFRDEVLSKFKSGEFSLERRKFTAGPEMDAALVTEREVKKAIEKNVRNALLTPEGGANVEAGQQVSLQAGSYHNMIYNLSQKILREMGDSEEFRSILGDPDKDVSISKRAQFLANIKESTAVRNLLEESEETTGGVIFSPEGYLELFNREASVEKENRLPESVWQQVSREFFRSTEHFVENYRAKRGRLDKLKDASNIEAILNRLNEASEQYDTKQAARKAAASFRTTVFSMLNKAKEDAMEAEAIKRLENYGFNLSILEDQLDRYVRVVGKPTKERHVKGKLGDVNAIVESFYNSIWFDPEAQMILHRGRTFSSKKATWEDLVRVFMKNKGIKRWENVEPITKFVADHILKIHQNDMLMKDLSDKQVQDALNKYTEYETEINALFETDQVATKTGFRKVDGHKMAMDKLLKDYKQATGEEAIANKLYLSIRRDAQKAIRLHNDAVIASELMSRIIESKEFSDARKAAAEVIKARPDRDIAMNNAAAHFPHPVKDNEFELVYDVSDKEGRGDQLKKLSIYVQSLNDWLSENAEDPYVEFWREVRDHASATMLTPTMRGGQSMKEAVNINLLRPIQNLLSGIGTFTSRLAQTHLDNLVSVMERSENWRGKHENKVVVALQAAAKSHGFGTDPIGVEDWFNSVGERYFATANFTGRQLEVGDKVTLSGMTDIKTITNEDKAALDAQVEAFGELFEMDVKEGRGALIRSRRTSDELKGVGGKIGKQFARKALKVTESTLPKTFSAKSIRVAQTIAGVLDDREKELSDIANDEGLTDTQKREMSLELYKAMNRKGSSIYSMVGENFNRFAFAFLDNREGRITDGTEPFFVEGVYDEARDAMLNEDISNMEELAKFFADRSADMSKLGDVDESMQLSKDEAMFEILREMSVQAQRFKEFINPKIDQEVGLNYKFAKLKKDSAFTTARQEPIANYFYYKYGVDETVGVANLSVDASAQYIDAFRETLTAIEGELDAAANDMKTAAERGNLEEFMEDKRQSAANKESFLDYERVEVQKSNVTSMINELDKVRDRDIRYELQVNKTFRRVFGDVIGVAIQMPTTAIANLIGTPVRSAMRMQALFGLAPMLNTKFAKDAMLEMAKGALTFGRGFVKGGLGALTQLATQPVGKKSRKALIRFVDEFVNKPFAEDFVIGQHKINSTLRRIYDAGYGMRIDVQGKIDSYMDSLETRGRMERTLDLRGRSGARSALSKFYNGAALFLAEIPGMVAPRLFDAVGNNMSFRFANTAISHLELRLKDLHRKYGDSLWDRYNDPDSLVKDPDKMDTLTPVDAFGSQFVFDPDESKLGKLENLFMHGGLDFHAEALRFYKSLDADKEAIFLTPNQRAQVGIGMVTAENLATIANRPLKLRNDPNAGFFFALSGWSLSAAHNSIEYLAKAQGGKQGWGINSLNVQMAMVMLGMMTVAGAAFAGQEELFRLIYKYLYGEVKVGRHPWEADSTGEAARRTLLYSLSGFPIVSAPINWMINDQKNMAAFGMELFIQNKVKNVLNAAGQIASTRSLEGAERATLIFMKQMYPNSRMMVNRIGSISGTVDLINNKRLVQRHAPRDMVKVSGYSGGASSATKLTPIISLMSNYAAVGDFDKVRFYFRRAVQVASDMGRPDPVRYVRSMYFGKDPYRAALKARVTGAVRKRVLEALDEEERAEFLRVEKNFYRGYSLIGGTPKGFGTNLSLPSVSRGRRSTRTRRYQEDPTPSYYLPRSSRPAPLRRAYGV